MVSDLLRVSVFPDVTSKNDENLRADVKKKIKMHCVTLEAGDFFLPIMSQVPILSLECSCLSIAFESA